MSRFALLFRYLKQGGNLAEDVWPRLCHPSTGFQSHRIGHTSGAARGEESPVGLMQSAIDSCPFHLECCLFPNYIGSLLIRPHRNKM